MKRNMSRCLRGALALTALAGLVASQPAAVVAGEEKVTICHIPPGNPDNAHTIVVGAPAVPAHLDHGDTLGECGGGGGGDGQ